MRHLEAWEWKNRVRQPTPVAVVVVRRRHAPSEAAARAAEEAARMCSMDVLGFDLDAVDNQAILDDVGIEAVPTLLVFCRGVLLEKGVGALDVDRARAVLDEAQLRIPRSVS